MCVCYARVYSCMKYWKNFAWREILINYLIIDIVINLKIIENFTENGKEKWNIRTLPLNILRKTQIYRLREKVVRLSIFTQCTDNDVYSRESQRFFTLVNITYWITVWFMISLLLLTFFFRKDGQKNFL